MRNATELRPIAQGADRRLFPHGENATETQSSYISKLAFHRCEYRCWCFHTPASPSTGASRAGCIQAAKETGDMLSFTLSGAAVAMFFGMILKNASASTGLFMSR